MAPLPLVAGSPLQGGDTEHEIIANPDRHTTLSMDSHNALPYTCATTSMRIPYTHIGTRGIRVNQAFDTKAPKKPTNVTINSDLLAKAKQLKINLSATLEAALSEMVNARQRELWRKQNKASIEAYNQLIEREGVFSDDMRSF